MSYAVLFYKNIFVWVAVEARVFASRICLLFKIFDKQELLLKAIFKQVAS